VHSTHSILSQDSQKTVPYDTLFVVLASSSCLLDSDVQSLL